MSGICPPTCATITPVSDPIVVVIIVFVAAVVSVPRCGRLGPPAILSLGHHQSSSEVALIGLPVCLSIQTPDEDLKCLCLSRLGCYLYMQGEPSRMPRCIVVASFRSGFLSPALVSFLPRIQIACNRSSTRQADRQTDTN